MASILPIVGTVAGSIFGGPVGGAIGGAAGSAIGSYIENEGEFSGEDALKAGISGVAGYGAGGGFNNMFGGGADAAVKGASAASGAAGAATGKAPSLIDVTAGGAGAAAPVAAVAPTQLSGGEGFLRAPNIPASAAPAVAPTAPPVVPQAPAPASAPGVSQAQAIPAASSAGTTRAVPQGWTARDSGLLGLSNSQLASYGGLGAVAALGSLGGGVQAAPLPVRAAPTLATSPTQRRFAAPGADYRPGYDEEHRYFQAARGGLVPGFFEGGETEGKGGDGGGKGDGGGAVSEGGGYQGGDGGGKGGGGSFGGSIDSGSGMSSVGSSPGPTGGGDPWGAGISSMGYSGGLDAGPGTGMGGGTGGPEGGGLAATQFGAPPPQQQGPRMMSTTPMQREYIAAPAGYRPGIDAPHTYFKPSEAPTPFPGTALAAAAPGQDSLFSPITPITPMAPINQVAAPIRRAEGGMIPVSRTVQAPRFIQRKVENKKSGIFDSLFGGGDDEYEMVEDRTPVLATKPIDRGYTPAPAGYRAGIDPEWDYFHDPVPVPPAPREPQAMAGGGIANARYIQGGDGDGLSDSVKGTIEGQEPVDLSVGEFVVPASIVSGLGNGSSEAGAKKLHGMMRRVRQARARMTEKDRPIPDSVMPA